MALESAAAAAGDILPAAHPLFELREQGQGGAMQISFAPLVREFVRQRDRGTPVEELAALFHDQFAAAWEAAVVRAVEQTGLICVALSGGVMCNAIIDRLLADRLQERGLNVLRHCSVPPNDGGLALGQAALAAYRATHGLVR
jgi:hydrogenase maturation protein HypF